MNNNANLPSHLDYPLLCVHCENNVFLDGAWANRKMLAESALAQPFDCQCGSFPREYVRIGNLGVNLIFVKKFEVPVG